MPTPRWPIRALRVCIAAAAVALAGWYSPLVATAGWHVFHPTGWLTFHGLRVRVPWPWITESDSGNSESGDASSDRIGEGVSLKKMPYTMDRSLSVETIFITVISPDPGSTAEQQTSGWLDSFRATHPGSAFNSAAPVVLPQGASCLSARSHWNPNGVVWTCISVPGGWVADFEGQAADVPVFFRIISELKRRA